MKLYETEYGDLVIPEALKIAEGRICASIHFLWGDADLLTSFAGNRFNAVHLNSNITGLSNQFAKPFHEDPSYFRKMLSAIEHTVAQHMNAHAVHIASISLSAFSAGYGAVREILAKEEYEPIIKTLFMLDTLYADWVSDEVRVPKLDDVYRFMLFAQAAARREKTLVLTHADYDCDHAGYCSTRKTANMLLAAVGGERKVVRNAAGTVEAPTSTCDVGHFHLLHFATLDHRAQLKLLPALWAKFGLGQAAEGFTKEGYKTLHGMR